MRFSRRHLISTAVAVAALPKAAFSKTATQITWDDLLPPGLPYSEIIAEGEMDERNDLWRPVFDENATKLNPAMNGTDIKMPGFIIPMDTTAAGISTFILVPYVGACIHVPPPPPNQLVYVTTDTPWPGTDLWEAIWVTGQIKHEIETYEVAQTGYALKADTIEVYVW